LGFGGIYVDEKLGGSGLGYFESSIIISELSYGCVPSAAYISIHNMVNGLINRFGSEEVK
jgi:alkylation response protein AidB-like acyl-CoA dehydrogenase